MQAIQFRPPTLERTKVAAQIYRLRRRPRNASYLSFCAK
jgi:hypothetical protein